MHKLDRYISRQVIVATVSVILVVVGLDAIFTILDQLKRLKGGFQMTQLLQFVALRLPRGIYEYLSLSCLIGTLIGLGTLANSSELNVMRAAGVSVWRILLSALKPVMFFAFMGLALGEFVIPDLERIAQTQKDVAQGKGTTFSSKGDKGYWHREHNNFMRFQAIEPNGVLHHLRIYGFDDKQELKQVTYATRALYQREHWVLEEVNITHFNGDSVTQSSAPSQRWESGLTPEALSLVVVNPADMSISSLYSYAGYLQDQGLDADKYLLSFWKKMLQPLSVIMLVLVGISFIFGSSRSSSMGARIVKGIVVGLLYRYGEEMLGPVSIVAGIDPVFASLIPASICGVFAVVLLRRAA